MKKSILCAGLIAGMSITGICFAETKPATTGSDLLEKRCSVCHPSARPKAAKKTAAEWEATVTKMIGKGAKLSAEEKKVLVDFLSKKYKP